MGLRKAQAAHNAKWDARQAEKEPIKLAKRLTKAREKRLKAWPSTPQAQARAAYARGDMVFQYSAPIVEQRGATIIMTSAVTHAQSIDTTPTLNVVAAEGWELQSTSTAFQQTTATSRDKFMSSGQQTAVSGQVIATYVFVRSEALHREAAAEPTIESCVQWALSNAPDGGTFRGGIRRSEFFDQVVAFEQAKHAPTL